MSPKQTHPVEMSRFLYSDSTLFDAALLTLYVSAIINIISLPFITAPYGRHARSGWGPTIPPSLAWFLMESPTLLISLPTYLFFLLPRGPTLSLLPFSLFLLHYLHRTLVYPLRLRNKPQQQQQRFPVSVALMALIFNTLNAYLQTRSISCYAAYENHHGWKTWVRVAVGMGMFFWGMRVNVTSDLYLVRLKSEGKGYRIPRGGWFEYVCCPNYMGEVAEWLGWAVVAWSPAAWGFFLYTCSNLVPRARANLKWYRDKFGEEFPASWKAIVPFVF